VAAFAAGSASGWVARRHGSTDRGFADRHDPTPTPWRTRLSCWHDGEVAEWVCLPRAINLGAVNKVGMPQLRKALTAAGFDDVRTYVQSGNVVLNSRLRSADKVGRAVRAVLKEDFGVDTPVLVRTPQQILDILAWNPFPEHAAERPTTVYVIHLEAEPDPARVSAELAKDWRPDGLAIRGLEACVSHSGGMRASQLQHAPLLKRLGASGTARNWRTLVAIAALLSAR
jgi:uncharacterized protein (DUF1697 family)